jgi:hypothetical protein
MLFLAILLPPVKNSRLDHQITRSLDLTLFVALCLSLDHIIEMQSNLGRSRPVNRSSPWFFNYQFWQFRRFWQWGIPPPYFDPIRPDSTQFDPMLRTSAEGHNPQNAKPGLSRVLKNHLWTAGPGSLANAFFVFAGVEMPSPAFYSLICLQPPSAVHGNHNRVIVRSDRKIYDPLPSAFAKHQILTTKYRLTAALHSETTSVKILCPPACS